MRGMNDLDHLVPHRQTDRHRVTPWAPVRAKQAQKNSCELLRKRDMEIYVTACKLMKLHESSWNIMQAH